MRKTTSAALIAAFLTLFSSAFALASRTATVTEKLFGETPSGEQVTQYTLTNTHGMIIQILNYGGILRSVRVPDRHGNISDVELGFDSFKSYETNSPYFGALIGRFGNRIAKGEFSLDGQTYHLYVNNGPNTLHGGKIGFNKKIWDATPFSQDGEVGLDLHYSSPDGEEHFPGNLEVNVKYTLTNDNTIVIGYTATTDADTVVNLTNHAYWDLAGQNKGSILGEWAQINGSHFTPTDATQIPTGEIRSVVKTPFDFLTLHRIGSRIHKRDTQLTIGAGYDHNWVLDKPLGQFGLAAVLIDPVSGRQLSIFTDQPGVQMYTGNFLDGVPTGKGGVTYHKNYGVAFETQHFPDSPNHDNFPTTELKPGETLHSITEYHFGITQAQLIRGKLINITTGEHFAWVRTRWGWRNVLVADKAASPLTHSIKKTATVVTFTGVSIELKPTAKTAKFNRGQRLYRRYWRYDGHGHRYLITVWMPGAHHGMFKKSAAISVPPMIPAKSAPTHKS